MLVIVLIIVIPGYFIIRRMSGSVYSENKRLEEETEKRYGFSYYEKAEEENELEDIEKENIEKDEKML